MLSALMLAPLLIAALHGGHFIPPAPDAGTPPAVEGIVPEPGLGPQIAFDPSRWEWWFDFNQEPLLDLRARMPNRARTAGARFEPATLVDRQALVGVFVDALQSDVPRNPLHPVRPRANTRDVRAAAVVSLGRLGLPEAVPYIELALEGDADLFVRTQAVLALGLSGNPQGSETLVRLFRDDKQPAEIRTYAAAGLALLGSPQTLDVLRASLAEKELGSLNNQLRAAVLYAAGVSGDATLGEPLRALVGTHLFGRETDVRSLTAFALGRVGDAASRPPLFELLADSDNQVRRSAAAALESLATPLEPPQVEQLIARLKTESDATVRHNLLRALGRTHSPVARALLHTAMTEGRVDDRPHVALALALDGDFTNGAPLLAALEKEREASITGALALALGLLGSPEAREPLAQRLLEAKDPLLQPNLMLALGLLDPTEPELAEHFEELVRKTWDVEVTRCGMIGLALLGERPRLVQLATDVGEVPGTIHRAAVAFGLGLAGDRHTILPLRALAADEQQPAYVRAYALQALGELGDIRPHSPLARLSGHVEMNLDVGFLFELYTSF